MNVHNNNRHSQRSSTQKHHKEKVQSWTPITQSLLDPVYTIQPVVKSVEQPVVKPVEQAVGQLVVCLFTRYTRQFNRFDNRLYRVNGVLDNQSCHSLRRMMHVNAVQDEASHGQLATGWRTSSGRTVLVRGHITHQDCLARQSWRLTDLNVISHVFRDL